MLVPMLRYDGQEPRVVSVQDTAGAGLSRHRVLLLEHHDQKSLRRGRRAIPPGSCTDERGGGASREGRKGGLEKVIRAIQRHIERIRLAGDGYLFTTVELTTPDVLHAISPVMRDRHRK